MSDPMLGPRRSTILRQFFSPFREVFVVDLIGP